jgi:hypothetical protein
VYINEDLTKPVAELFHEARQLIKHKRLHSAWTTGGVLHVKKTEGRGERSVKITSLGELTSLASS